MFDLFKSKDFKVGLVLGGGGARGFAHLGAVKALQEKGIEFDVISGVSAGAIAGAFLATGLGPEEALNKLKNKGIFNFSRLHLPVNGLLKLDGLEKELKKYIKVENIEDCEIPFIIGMSNLNEGRIEYVNEGPLIKTVLASSSIPVLFSPIEMNGFQYVDGGLFDNLPVKPLKGKCEKIIAVNISPINKADKLENLVQISKRMFQLGVNQHSEINKKDADIVIEPDGLREYDILAGGSADDLFTIGYEHTKNQTINL